METRTTMKEFAEKLAVILFEEKVEASQGFNRFSAELEREHNEKRRQYDLQQKEYYDGCLRTIEYIERKVIDIL